MVPLPEDAPGQVQHQPADRQRQQARQPPAAPALAARIEVGLPLLGDPGVEVTAAQPGPAHLLRHGIALLTPSILPSSGLIHLTESRIRRPGGSATSGTADAAESSGESLGTGDQVAPGAAPAPISYGDGLFRAGTSRLATALRAASLTLGSPDPVISRTRGSAATASGPNRATASMTVSTCRNSGCTWSNSSTAARAWPSAGVPGPIWPRAVATDPSSGLDRTIGRRDSEANRGTAGAAAGPNDPRTRSAKRRGHRSLEPRTSSRKATASRRAGPTRVDPTQGLGRSPGAQEDFPGPRLAQELDQGGHRWPGGGAESDQGLDRLPPHRVVTVAQRRGQHRDGLTGRRRARREPAQRRGGVPAQGGSRLGVGLGLHVLE